MRYAGQVTEQMVWAASSSLWSIWNACVHTWKTRIWLDTTWLCPRSSIPSVEDEKWGCFCNSHTSTPAAFSSVREDLRGRNSWPRKEELEVIVRRCRSPWEALEARDWWAPPGGPLAGEVSLEALVDWKETDMPESREPTLPRRTVCPTSSVNHITTFTTSQFSY